VYREIDSQNKSRFSIALIDKTSETIVKKDAIQLNKDNLKLTKGEKLTLYFLHKHRSINLENGYCNMMQPMNYNWNTHLYSLTMILHKTRYSFY